MADDQNPDARPPTTDSGGSSFDSGSNTTDGSYTDPGTGADVSVTGDVTTIDMPPETVTAEPDNPAPPPSDANPIPPPIDPNYHGPEMGPADPNAVPNYPPDDNFNDEGKFDPLRVLGDHLPEEF